MDIILRGSVIGEAEDRFLQPGETLEYGGKCYVVILTDLYEDPMVLVRPANAKVMNGGVQLSYLD